MQQVLSNRITAVFSELVVTWAIIKFCVPAAGKSLSGFLMLYKAPVLGLEYIPEVFPRDIRGSYF